MATGNTTTSSLADSIPRVIAAAIIVGEQEGGMQHLVDRQKLGEGVGTTWNEISLAKLSSAQDITESTVLDNPQQLSDSVLSVEPTVVGIMTVITDRVAARISKNAYARTGALAQNAIERKKDEDGIAVLDGFSNSYGGAGSTLTSGHVGAAMAVITGNSTEPGKAPFRCDSIPISCTT